MLDMLQGRRRVLRFLAAGSLCTAWPRAIAATAPSFLKGAIIRTILNDLSPESLAGGATLFHEHMSLAPDFLSRCIAYSRPGSPVAPVQPVPAGQKYFLEDLDLMTTEMKTAKASGVAL